MSPLLRLLLDTNVWLDLYIPRRPFGPSSRELIDLSLSRGYVLLYPVRILGDVFYQIQAEAKHWVRQSTQLTEAYAHAIADHAWDCVDDMRGMATAVGADETDVWLARKLRATHNDLEDNFVLAAAERVKADFLVSNDAGLLRHASVAAHTPLDMLAILKGL